MAVAQGNILSSSDIQSYYDTFNSFMSHYGGSMVYLPTVSGKVTAKNIQDLYNRVETFRSDRFLGTEPTFWELSAQVTVGDLVTPSDLTPYNSIISNMNNVKCRNEADNYYQTQACIPQVCSGQGGCTQACSSEGTCSPKTCSAQGSCNPKSCSAQGSCNPRSCSAQGSCNPQSCSAQGSCNPRSCSGQGTCTKTCTQGTCQNGTYSYFLESGGSVTTYITNTANGTCSVVNCSVTWPSCTGTRGVAHLGTAVVMNNRKYGIGRFIQTGGSGGYLTITCGYSSNGVSCGYDTNTNSSCNYSSNPNSSCNYGSNPNSSCNYSSNPNSSCNYDSNTNSNCTNGTNTNSNCSYGGNTNRDCAYGTETCVKGTTIDIRNSKASMTKT